MKKERSIVVNLSDEDCEMLIKKCGEYSLTVSELIKNFVSDLVDGSESNGTDERMYINQWFSRCWFGSYQPTLLAHLISHGYQPEDYLKAMQAIDSAREELKIVTDEEEIQDLKDDIRYYQDEIKNMEALWNIENPDMDEELELVRKWVKERECFGLK